MVKQTSQRRWRNAAYWLGLNVGLRLVGLVRSSLLARLLAPELASLGFLAVSVGEFARAALSSGTSQLVVAAKKSDDELLSAAWGLELLKGVGLASGLVAVGCLALLVPSLSGWAQVCMVASVVPLSVAFCNPALYQWEREGNHGRVALALGLGNLVGVAVAAALIWWFPRWWVVPLCFAAGNLGATLLTHCWGTWRSTAFVLRVGRVVRLFSQGIPYLSIGLANYFSSTGIDLALGLFGAVSWVAPFRFAMALVYSVITALPAVLARAAFAADAELFRSRSPQEDPEVHLPTLTFISGATAMLVPLCSLLLPETALFLYGEQWKSTGQLIPLLGSMVGLRMLSRPLGNVFLSLGEPRAEARILLIEAVASTLAIGVLANSNVRLGLMVGCALALISIPMRLSLLRKRSVRCLARSLAVLTVAACPVLLAGTLESPLLLGLVAIVGPILVVVTARLDRKHLGLG